MYYTPAIGDLLIRDKALGIFDHIGVVVAPNTVLQNTPERGEHLAPVEEFAAGQPIKVRLTGADSSRVAARARKILANAKAYNPFSRNCEHTASEVLHGVAKSPQLLFYVGLGLVVFSLVVFWPRR
jgi:hypothetical protein